MAQMNNYGAAQTTLADLAAKVLVRGTETKFHGLKLVNGSGSSAYVQIFNAATTAAVTLGTTVPVWEAIIANGADADYVDEDLLCTSGIVIAATTTERGATPIGTGLYGSIMDYPNETKLATAIPNHA